jgi:hypothetical protein
MSRQHALFDQRERPDAAVPAGGAVLAGGPLAFPTAREKSLEDMTLSGLLRDLEIAVVPHGFRSSLRDWAAEEAVHPRWGKRRRSPTWCGTRSRPPMRGPTCSSAADG